MVAWLRMTSAALRLAGTLRWIRGLWSVIGTAAVVARCGDDVGACAGREVYHPWYAHPDRLFLLLWRSA